MPLDPSTSSSIPIPILNASEQTLLQAKGISYMDSVLFKAAEDGNMEPFNKYQGDLCCLVDGRQNTALHIYAGTGGSPVVKIEKRFLCFQKKIFQREFSINFAEQLVNKCSISVLLQPNAKGEIPLHIAARHGHSEIVKFFIEHVKSMPPEDLEKGFEATSVRMTMRQMLSMEDKEENTALHKAATSGDPETVKLLLKELDTGCFSFSDNTSGETPLYIAAKKGYERVVAEMLFNRKSIDFGGPDGTTALHAAVLSGSEKTVEKLIEAKKHLIRETDDKGRTPLHYAAYFGNRSLLERLLKTDSSAAYICDKGSGATALHMAAWGGFTGIMEDIIRYCPGCCEIVDKRGWNFLHSAVFTSKLTKLYRLLNDKNKIKELQIRNLLDQKDVKGNTPLDVLIFGSSDYRPGEFAISRWFESKFDESVIYNRKTKKKQIRELLIDIRNNEAVAGTSFHQKRFPKNESGKKKDILKEDIKDKAREAHLVVATLVATVTFAAALTVPGGYKSEQGSATLSHDSAFKAFVITDTLAFVCSLLAIFLHFFLVNRLMITNKFTLSVIRWIKIADFLTFFAMAAMVVAFSTGTYAVFRSSLGFAIATCSLVLIIFPGLLTFLLYPFITELMQ